MIEWDKPDERYFSTGTDRGVLFPKDGPAVPWNGIIGVTESGAGETTVLYRDGQIFYTDVAAGDYSGSLTAFFWPEEFSKCLGMPQIAPGLYADYQKPRHFGLSYRSLVGNGSRGNMFGYQIHLVYNAVASAQSRTRKTLTETPSMDEFVFDLTATPVKIRGFRPTAHFIIDTRGLSQANLTYLETRLYVEGVMPDADWVYDLLKFGDAVLFEYLPNGRVRVRGTMANIYTHPEDSGRIILRNVNAVANPSGSLILSDTP